MVVGVGWGMGVWVSYIFHFFSIFFVHICAVTSVCTHLRPDEDSFGKWLPLHFQEMNMYLPSTLVQRLDRFRFPMQCQ